MKLTAGQETALQHVRDLQKAYPEGGAIGVIAGYAGTGKTTLISILREEHDDNLLVVTPTGKAAVRAREAAGARAKTIHSWMYEVTEDQETGRLEWGLRPLGTVELPGCGYLVVDEASMVGYETFRDLYNYTRKLGLNLILVGDGFQLPPVEVNLGRKEFSVFEPDMPAVFKIQLTEIVRQALDSPIIRVSQAIREGRWTEEALGELRAVPESRLFGEGLRVWEQGGATVCHRNATRHDINAGIRALRNLPLKQFKQGEPLLVTQNNYGLEIYNGEVTEVLSEPEGINRAPVHVEDRFNGSSCYVNYYGIDVHSAVLGPRRAVVADREVFGTLGKVGAHVVRREGRYLLKSKYDQEDPERPVMLSANLGYTLTCHKSQGSEFPEVMVVLEDSLRLNTPDGKRWAYTAITRAKSKVCVCWRR